MKRRELLKLFAKAGWYLKRNGSQHVSIQMALTVKLFHVILISMSVWQKH